MTQGNIDKRTIERPEWLPSAAWPFEIRTTLVNRAPIAYTDEGAGPLLLLVHDGMWSFVWGQAIARLRHRFRVITLDFPGSGLSPQAPDSVGLEADSRVLEGFVDTLGLEVSTLVLHDLGGPVGLGLAARRPELVNGMVLVNTFGWPPHVRLLRVMMRLMSSRPVRAMNMGTNFLARATSSRFGVGQHLDNEEKKGFVAPYAQDREPRRRFHTLMGAPLAETDYLARLEKSLRSTLNDRPVLTVYGARNDPFGFQARFKAIFPDAAEMVMPKGNHFPMCDNPDAFCTRIAEWHEIAIRS